MCREPVYGVVLSVINQSIKYHNVEVALNLIAIDMIRIISN